MSKCWRNKKISKTQITTSIHKIDYVMFISDEFKYKLMCL